MGGGVDRQVRQCFNISWSHGLRQAVTVTLPSVLREFRSALDLFYCRRYLSLNLSYRFTRRGHPEAVISEGNDIVS